MTAIVTQNEMRALESTAIASGAASGEELMERAGAAAAGAIRTNWPALTRAVILCGPGNNGGDGYVVARHLQQAGWQVSLHGETPAADRNDDATSMARRWQGSGQILPFTAQAMADSFGKGPAVLVDALLGLGQTRSADNLLIPVRQALSGGARGIQVAAIDIPTGIATDSGATLGAHSLAADLTITFHALKPCHLLLPGALVCGRVEVADIGLIQGDSALERATPTPALRKVTRGEASHKYSYGHLLVIAGGRGHVGAARLAAKAALRGGAGLVTLGAPTAALPELALPPDALMREALGDSRDLRTVLGDGRINAVCAGPGAGIDRIGEMLATLLGWGRPMVLDADALSALALRRAPYRDLHAGCVLTPHGGEFTRLFPEIAGRMRAGLQSKTEAVRAAAALSGATVLLKGPDTVIARPDGAMRIHSALDVPWLATAGAGDVLAGIIAGLLARGFDPLDAAATGAWLHAAAARDFGPGLIADDLPDRLPAVLRGLAA